MHPEYEISALSAESNWGEIVDVFRKNGWSRSLAAVHWQYKESPTKRVYVNVARQRDSTAALYASLPNFFQSGGRDILGIQSLDTLTDENHRGNGLFKGLAQDLFERVESHGLGLVYGFPNAASAPGFFSSLGWECLDPVPFLVRPINLSYFIKTGVPAGLRSLPALPISEKFEIREVALESLPLDEIWEEFRVSFDTGLIRDARYLKWRFSKPNEDYRVFAAFDAGEVCGFLVLNVMEKHGGRIGYVMELMTRRPSKAMELAHELLNSAVRYFHAQRCDAALAWHFPHSPYFLAYLTSGFLPLPERLRPIELHFGCRSFNGAKLTRKDWYLSYCDSDTV
jgi:hypothetical protein